MLEAAAFLPRNTLRECRDHSLEHRAGEWGLLPPDICLGTPFATAHHQLMSKPCVWTLQKLIDY